MTLSSDQNPDPGKLSTNGRRMLALRDEVLEEWIKRLRQTVKEAERLPQPILINTFPALYDNLAEAISPGYPRATANEGNTVASEHGSERARLTNYNANSVIGEYQQLRWTIFDVLKLNGVGLDDNEVFVINTSIDGSIRESVNAFALAQAALRQRFVAALTHDLRNPLCNAQVYAQLIERATDPVKTKEFAGKIFDSLKQMDGMIQELLDSAALQSGEGYAFTWRNSTCKRSLRRCAINLRPNTGPASNSRAVRRRSGGIGRQSGAQWKIWLAMP